MMGVSRSKSYPVEKGCQFVGNKTKGQISKQVLQENKARQILRKMKQCIHQSGHFVILKSIKR